MQVVLTGAKKREDIYRAFESIYPVLQTFRKGGEWPPNIPTPCLVLRSSGRRGGCLDETDAPLAAAPCELPC